jgi:hypothetical protein
MNKERNIIIIIFSALGVLALLAVALYFNSLYSSKNIDNNTKSPATKNVSTDNMPAASSTMTQAEIDYKNKIKASILKEMDRISKTAPKTIADVQKSIDDCAGLKTEIDKNTCITLWAEYKKNSDLCAKIASASHQDCLDRVAAAKATK